ncbi:MAG: regulatory protein RecX [Gemmatimonadota bacterium]|nr:regulatory protein RecX [Gemmatimonadota bacterium]MDQ8146704.1 regulatory protein RecX [Gemmatimonadota bacterium]
MTQPRPRTRRADRPPPPPESCTARAVDALARRAYARVELGQHLLRKGFTEPVVTEALARLADRGYLDDLAYARGFVHSRMTGRAFGPRRVRTELARRGVAPALVDQVLAERAADAESAPEDGALVAGRRRMGALRGLAPDVARRRLVGWLVRRGFGMGESMRAARQLLAASASAADDPGCVDPED